MARTRRRPVRSPPLSIPEIDTTFHRRCERHIARHAELVEPLADNVAGEEVASRVVGILVAEPTDDECLHASIVDERRLGASLIYGHTRHDFRSSAQREQSTEQPPRTRVDAYPHGLHDQVSRHNWWLPLGAAEAPDDVPRAHGSVLVRVLEHPPLPDRSHPWTVPVRVFPGGHADGTGVAEGERVSAHEGQIPVLGHRGDLDLERCHHVALFSVVLVALLVSTGRPPSPIAIALFLWYLINFAAIVVGFSLAASVLFMQYRDLNQVWEVVTHAGFFVAPIIYPIDVLPERLHFYLYMWPPTPVILFSRAVLVDDSVPSLLAHGLLTAEAAVVLAFGALIYSARAPRVPEYL